MEFELRKHYFNLCNPSEPLSPTDARYLDMDGMGDRTQHYVRGTNWVSSLATEIELSCNQPIMRLLSGHPGSGKTTELKRLAAELAKPDGLNLLPIHIDAEDFVDIHSPIETTTLLTAIHFSLEMALAQASGDNWEKFLEKGYFNRLWTWLSETEFHFNKAELSIPSAAKLVFEMKDRPKLRRLIETTISDHFSQFYTEFTTSINEMYCRIRSELRKSGIIFIFDGLEKVRGIGPGWPSVLDSTEQVFGAQVRYLRMPFHVIYTVPTSLIHRIKDVDFLPMIQINAKDGSVYEPGMLVARELIRLRIPDEHIFMLLSNAHIEMIIALSGGYMRDLLKIIRWVLNFKQYPITELEIAKITNRLRNQYQEVIPKEAIPWLSSVAKTRFMVPENKIHIELAGQMLANHVILGYYDHADERKWYDLHPTVKELIATTDHTIGHRDG